MLGGADPVRVDRLDVVGVRLPAPAEQELLRGGLSTGDDVIGSRRASVVDGGRLRDDRHHLGREPREVVPGLPVVDVDDLAQVPDA